MLKRETHNIVRCSKAEIARSVGVGDQLLRQQQLDPSIVLQRVPRALYQYVLMERREFERLSSLTGDMFRVAEKSLLVYCTGISAMR
jgi:hypothetical protein